MRTLQARVASAQSKTAKGMPTVQANGLESQMTDIELKDGRLQILNDVRTLIDWLEAHPEITIPYDFENGFMLSSVNTRDELIAVAREFKECEKVFSNDSFYLHKRFGQASLYAFTSRTEVCERVVVGSEEVAERVIPAHVRDVVEWRCAEPLLNGGGK